MLGGELQVAKRKLRKPVTLASSTSLESTYDRRATDLLRNAQVAPAIVDDPLEPGAKLVVLRSLRHDPLAAMHSLPSNRSMTRNSLPAGTGNAPMNSPRSAG
jgi:hypothetical protein